ncbi:MAG: NAD(P)H-dependent oxidoreductase [Brevibacillus sp.]|nr:NAD(P)H-dependent oxidoreductase [Brevibacillus sp.]
MIRVLLLSGSVATPAHTHALIEAVAALLKQTGCEPIIWDLRERPLPIADPDYHYEPERHPEQVVQELVSLAKAADAFVLGSPNYHNSYSGVLKNALDTLNMDHFRDKPVGLVGNGGGLRSTQPLDHLRIVVRGLLGVAIPIQVASCRHDFERQADKYVITADDLKQRIAAFTQQLVTYAVKLKA